MQTDMFPKERKPRAKPLKRMRVADAGEGGGFDVIQFECGRCGHNTGWIYDTLTMTENKRGLPCPKCNPQDSTGEQA